MKKKIEKTDENTETEGEKTENLKNAKKEIPALSLKTKRERAIRI